MENKDKFESGRGAGLDPIPDPDDSELGREGFSGKAEDVVGGIMDNVEKAITGESDTDSDTNQKRLDEKK